MIEMGDRVLDVLLARDPGGPVVMPHLPHLRPRGLRSRALMESVLKPTVPKKA